MKKIRFTIDEEQRKNLFDLSVFIIVLLVFVLCFSFGSKFNRIPNDHPLSSEKA